MSEIGIVVKVPAEIHSRLKEACQKNKRSMAKVVEALIESWLRNGAPDPYGWNGAQHRESEPKNTKESVESLLVELTGSNAEDLKKHALKIELLSRKLASIEENCLVKASQLEQEIETLKSEVGSLNRKQIKINRIAGGGSANNPFIPLVTDEDPDVATEE